jgi:MraZ protein
VDEIPTKDNNNDVGVGERVAVFRGRYQHTIDTKGRVFLPSDLREGLTNKFILFMINEDDKKCVCAMAAQDYENFAMGVIQDNNVNDAHPELMDEVLYPDTQDVELDSQNRVLIPQDMREEAVLDKDVVIVGIRNRVEFWNLNAWNERKKLVAEKTKGVSISKLLATH